MRAYYFKLQLGIESVPRAVKVRRASCKKRDYNRRGCHVPLLNSDQASEMNNLVLSETLPALGLHSMDDSVQRLECSEACTIIQRVRSLTSCNSVHRESCIRMYDRFAGECLPIMKSQSNDYVTDKRYGT
jgi:hypothetical protein